MNLTFNDEYLFLARNRNFPETMPASPPPPARPAGLERYVIPNLRNACRVLKRLALDGAPMSVSELARVLRLPPTTALRIVATLELEGLVARRDGRVSLGPALLSMGSLALEGSELREAAVPILARLTASTGETSHVAVPSGGRSLILAVCDSPHPLRAASRPGYQAELHCSSTGKAFLAFCEPALPIPARLVRRTPRTLVSAAALAKEIEATRRRGYAVDDEEYHEGVRCVAAPVRGVDGRVVAAVGITAAAVRLPPAGVAAAARLVQTAAAELSGRLGFG
jgi:DNA-binding IclR family transcriptional regulator